MPKFKSELLEEDIPTTSRVTVKESKIENSLNIYDLVKKEKKKTKEQVGVTLDKEIVDKLKTVVIDSNLNMSKLFENLLRPLLEDVVINEEYVKAYDNKNKAKGKRIKK